MHARCRFLRRRADACFERLLVLMPPADATRSMPDAASFAAAFIC